MWWCSFLTCVWWIASEKSSGSLHFHRRTSIPACQCGRCWSQRWCSRHEQCPPRARLAHERVGNVSFSCFTRPTSDSRSLYSDLNQIRQTIRRLGSWWFFSRIWGAEKELARCRDILQQGMDKYVLLLRCSLSQPDEVPTESPRKTPPPSSPWKCGNYDFGTLYLANIPTLWLWSCIAVCTLTAESDSLSFRIRWNPVNGTKFCHEPLESNFPQLSDLPLKSLSVFFTGTSEYMQRCLEVWLVKTQFKDKKTPLVCIRHIHC